MELWTSNLQKASSAPMLPIPTPFLSLPDQSVPWGCSSDQSFSSPIEHEVMMSMVPGCLAECVCLLYSLCSSGPLRFPCGFNAWTSDDCSDRAGLWWEWKRAERQFPPFLLTDYYVRQTTGETWWNQLIKALRTEEHLYAFVLSEHLPSTMEMAWVAGKQVPSVQQLRQLVCRYSTWDAVGVYQWMWKPCLL